MKRYFAYLLALAMLSSCHVGLKSSDPLPANFFTGEFVYFADAPVFYDCANGLHYPVAMEGDYLAVEREYLDFASEMGERIWVALRGHIEFRPGMEEDRKEATMVVDALVRFDREASCNRSFLIAGIYQSDVEGIRSILRLRPNYRFAETVYAGDGTETVREGDWGSVSQAEVALDYDSGEQMIYEVFPSKESIARTDRRKQYTYKKVYMN